MPQIDPAQAITIFVGNLPTFIAVILAWMHSNGTLSDTNARISDLRADTATRISDLKAEMHRESNDTCEILRAEFRRVEEVIDAGLKHLEEND